MAQGRILRQSRWFEAIAERNGVRIKAKDPNVRPKSKVVSWAAWETLQSMDDASFDGTIVMEIGVGVWAKES